MGIPEGKTFDDVIAAAGTPCAVRSDATTVWAWNRLNGLDVRVLAVRLEESSDKWIFVAACGSEAVMQGMVYGGRGRARAYMRAVRDGITARAMRRRGK